MLSARASPQPTGTEWSRRTPPVSAQTKAPARGRKRMERSTPPVSAQTKAPARGRIRMERPTPPVSAQTKAPARGATHTPAHSQPKGSERSEDEAPHPARERPKRKPPPGEGYEWSAPRRRESAQTRAPS
ncbi:hypothetical protein DB30_05078 [Enhygromyxa salina]|uniref:Uncharacterized protein n=1 Tax=Enhygromyxa salina TaxID=215803 RepID=A0A0C1ZEC6_9BACT|nr:hypothetical protein DB30_05078 [Enhygromyxa salina]